MCRLSPQLCHVLLLHRHVISRPEAREVATDISLERVTKRLSRRSSPPEDILRFAKIGERDPTGEDDVDEHQRPLCRRVDEDVAWRVVRPVIVELQRIAAYAQGHGARERVARNRPVRVYLALQQRCDIFVGVELGPLVQDHCTRMISVVVTVDGIGHCRRRHRPDGPEDVVPDGRRGIDGDDTVRGDEEHHLVEAVGQPEQAVLDLLDEVPDFRDGRAFRRRRHGSGGRHACGPSHSGRRGEGTQQ